MLISHENSPLVKGHSYDRKREAYFRNKVVCEIDYTVYKFGRSRSESEWGVLASNLRKVMGNLVNDSFVPALFAWSNVTVHWHPTHLHPPTIPTSTSPQWSMGLGVRGIALEFPLSWHHLQNTHFSHMQCMAQWSPNGFLFFAIATPKGPCWLTKESLQSKMFQTWSIFVQNSPLNFHYFVIEFMVILNVFFKWTCYGLLVTRSHQKSKSKVIPRQIDLDPYL